VFRLKLVQSKIGTVDVLRLCGPLTDEDCETFREQVLGRLRGTNSRVVLELVEVPYVDSQGLEVLLELSQAQRRQGHCLKMAAVPPTCREIFDLTELLGEFEIFDEVDDAVRSFM
jgi:anti-anti-sigma factor